MDLSTLKPHQLWTFTVALTNLTAPHLAPGPTCAGALEALLAATNDPATPEPQFISALATFRRTLIDDVAYNPGPHDIRPARGLHRLLEVGREARTLNPALDCTGYADLVHTAAIPLANLDPGNQWVAFAETLNVNPTDRPLWVSFADTWDGTPAELTAAVAALRTSSAVTADAGRGDAGTIRACT